ncbi:MAG: hypothetical protein GF355_13815, partial [Candidatus Eisenbacteria bacterium]|nr:hypothetical protein [Candidatus Eisenbacteria bacterium]
MRWAAVLLLITAGFIQGCSLEEPQAPSFDTDFYIPLGTERSTGIDILRQEDHIQGDSTGFAPLQFVLDGDLGRFVADDFLEVTLDAAQLSASLASIEMEPPDPVGAEFLVGELSGLPLPPGGAPIIVPPFHFSQLRHEAGDQDRMEWVRLAGGRAEIEIANETAVAVGGPQGTAEELNLCVLDRDAGRPVFDVALQGTVEPGQSESWNLDLAGVELVKRMDLEIGGGSPGSGGDPVWVDPSQSLQVSVQFRDLEADSVLAVVESQASAFEDNLALPDDLQIIEGKIMEGAVRVRVINELPLAARTDLVFEQLLRPSEDTVRVQLTLPAAQSGPDDETSVTIPLDNALLDMGGVLRDSLSYRLHVETDGSGGEAIALGRRQSVKASTAESSIAFEWVRGSASGRRIDVSGEETAVEPPEGIEDLDFLHATLAIDVTSSVGLTSAAQLTLAARGEGGALIAELPLDMTLVPGSRAAPGTSRLILDETNSAVLDIIHGRP